jgi:transcriptional regulator with XRE-family HTH domain
MVTKKVVKKTLNTKETKSVMGERLRAARLARGFTLVALAARTEGRLSSEVLGHYERGRNQPRAGDLKMLSRILGKRAAYLYGLEEPEQTRLLDLFEALPSEQQQAYMDAFQRILAIGQKPPGEEAVAPSPKSDHSPENPGNTRPTRSRVSLPD